MHACRSTLEDPTGSRTGKPKLAHAFKDDEAAVEAVRKTRFGNQATKTKYSLDRTAALKLLQLKGAAGKALAGLGFTIDQGETFFVERTEQQGTIGAP